MSNIQLSPELAHALRLIWLEEPVTLTNEQKQQLLGLGLIEVDGQGNCKITNAGYQIAGSVPARVKS
jgi:hypothetical protein